jgi:uncharacterized protein YraI
MRNRVPTVVAVVLGTLLVAAIARPAPVGAVSCGPCPATATADLNLRAGPSLSAAVLRVIPAGAAVSWDPFQAGSGGYVAVTYDGTAGWAHGDYLLRFPTSATVTASLNLRDGPSLGAAVLAVMPPGTQVQVLGGPENGFFSVRYGQTAGFAFADYLDLAAGPPSPPPAGGGYAIGTQVVTTALLNYRTGAGTGYDVITVLGSGTRGAVLDGPVTAGGYTWYALGLPGYGPDGATPGWVAGEFLTAA